MSLNDKKDNVKYYNDRVKLTYVDRWEGKGTHIVLYGLWMVYTLHSLTTQNSFLLVAEGLWGVWKQGRQNFMRAHKSLCLLIS